MLLEREWVGQVCLPVAVCSDNVKARYGRVYPLFQSSMTPRAHEASLLFTKKAVISLRGFVLLLSIKHKIAQYGLPSLAKDKKRTTYTCTHFYDTVGMAYKAVVVAEVK